MPSTHYSVSGEGSKVIVTFSVLTSITTIAIALRVYVRGWMIKNFGIDDWVAIIGWLGFVVLSSLMITAAHHGFGQHANLIEPHSEIEIGLRLSLISELSYAVSNLAVKLSICFALLRFVNERSQTISLYMVMASTSISCIALFFLLIFQCSPVSFYWQRSRGDIEGKCLNENILFVSVYIYSVISVLCDWIMALLPWILVRKLRMSTREKTLVIFVLAMDSVASIAALGRFGYAKGFTRTDDLLHELADIAIWSGYETGLGLFASCIATLRPLLRSSCIQRQRASPRQEPINLPAIANHSHKIKRPRLPWSEFFDTIAVDAIKSSYASTGRTASSAFMPRTVSKVGFEQSIEQQ